MEPDREDWVVPGRRYIIKRPRLTRLLDGSKARVRMLIAPAGYGKTTLAREWFEKRPHAWYQGTAASADVAALAAGLGKTASNVVPQAGYRMVERLRATGMPENDVQVLAELLAEDLVGWPDETWFVIDDFHFATESEASERFVELLFELAPIRLFLTSRVRPRWATARRLLYGEVFEVGSNQLAMSPDEGAEVLADRAGEAPGLVALAEGWPAVIGLAALAEDFELPGESVQDALFDYFAEELYQAPAPSVQRGLCELAFASSITLDLAEAILGESAATVLATGVRLGALVPSKTIYEVHPLLRRFLRAKLKDHPGATDVVDRLGRLLVERALWDDAFSIVKHFFSEELFTNLFEIALPAMLEEARLPTVLRWLECARKHRVDSAITNLAEAEVALRAGELETAEALSLRAADLMNGCSPLASRAMSVAGLCAHLTYRDEIAFQHYQLAEALAKTDQDARQAEWGEFIASVAQEREGTAEIFEQFAGHQDTSLDHALRIANGRLILALVNGAISADLDFAKAMRCFVDRSTDPLARSSFLNSYASTLILAARYGEALEAAVSELAAADEYRLDFVVPHGLMYKAAALLGLRNFRQCRRVLSQANLLRGIFSDPFFRTNFVAIEARLQLALGLQEEAVALMETHRDVPVTLAMQAEYSAWFALLLAGASDTKQAVRVAAKAEALTGRVEVRGVVPWARAMVALQQRTAGATREVEQAFNIAQHTGNFEGFVTSYRACPDILQHLARRKSNLPPLISVVQRARDDALGASAGIEMPTEVPKGAESLSNREREVYFLLGDGLRSREIARKLFITESTVKVHLRHIYEKLGVRSRTEAAVLAVADLADQAAPASE
jgi:ATP/maltotriose-dependent transcriptional regulator MalT